MKNYNLILLSLIFSVLMVLPSAYAFDESANETEVVEYVENMALKETPSYYFNSSQERDGEGTKSNPYNELKKDRLKDNSDLHFANGEYTFNHEGYEPLYNVNFYGQDASQTIIDGRGCEIINYNGYLYFENITLKNFLFVNIQGSLEAKNSIFTSSNRTGFDSEYDGGAIYAYATDVKLTNCTIKDNAAFKGGAVYVEKGILEIINSDFINNTALYYGGSIAIHYSSNVLISNSRFSNGKALANAGAGIYLYESGLTLNYSNFTNMQAKMGSAITSLSSNMVLDRIRCENNIASYEGGAVYSMYETVTLTNSIFVNNTAKSGGALFIDSVEQPIISSNYFIDNEAIEYGGAICSLFNNVGLDANTYQNNHARNGNDKYESSSVNLVFRDGNYTLYSITDYIGGIPTRYSLVEDGFVTSVKNQGANGNCWAFSALAVLESCILKAGGNVVDLSENNLKNLITLYSDYGYDKVVNDGGNFKMALAYLASWLGPILEQDDPYDANSVLSTFMDSIMHVQNALFFTRTDYLDNDEIKRAILKYGAVATSMYYDDYFLSGDYYYCCDEDISSDHAVTVVGWDDTININGRTGAWLVKNSWGPNWGNNGYFYVSYYDRTLLQVGKEDGYTLILNDTVAFDKNYQHETTGVSTTWVSGGNGYKFKNVFHSTEEEYLAAVSTYFSNPAEWTVEILVNGDLKHYQSGYIGQAGYFTINLNTPVKLSRGDKFEVIIGLTSDEGKSFFSLSRANKAVRDANYRPEISYRISPSGMEYDMNNDGMVACIKAFTLTYKESYNKLTIASRGEAVDVVSTITDKDGNLINGGAVTFNVNGVLTTVDVINGVAILSNVILGEVNNISSTFHSGEYMSSSNATSFARTTIFASDLTVVYDNDETYSIILTDILNGEVSGRKVVFSLSNGQVVTTYTDVDGVAYLPIDLDAGVYTVDIGYAGFGSDDIVYGTVKSIKVTKKEMVIRISSSIHGNNAVIQISAANIDDDLIVSVDGERINKKIVNGYMTFSLMGLARGIHHINVESSLNYKFLNNTHSFNVVSLINTQIRANNIVDYSNRNILYSVQLLDQYGNPLKGMEMLFSINGNSYKRTTDSNGHASIPINLPQGSYNLGIGFKGNVNYAASYDTVNVLIKPTIILENKVYDSQFSVTLIKGDGELATNQKVKIRIGGEDYFTTTNSEGVAYIPLNLPNGHYEVEITNLANGEVITQSIEIAKKTTKPKVYNWIVGNKDLKMYYGEGKLFTVRVCNDEGKYVSGLKVTFKINGVSIRSVSNSNGFASVKINLKAGKYKITTSYHGKTVKNNIIVKPTLTAKNIKVKKGKTIKFNAKLVDIKGKALKNKKITFKIKGKSYKVKTNKKGIATLKLKLKLKVGKHTVKTSYGKNIIKNTIFIKR